MNRRLVSGTVAALAAVALAAGGSTFAAFDDYAEITTNRAGAGTLALDLGMPATLDFTGLEPGVRTGKLLWVAANDASSAVPAVLAVTVRHLVDVPGPCAVSRGKAEGELASGIGGCVVTATTISGTPRIGTASRMLDVRAAYAGSATSAAACSGAADGTASLLPVVGRGDLYTLANAHGGAGTTVPVLDRSSRPVVLQPGRGVCLAVSAYWPPSVTGPASATPERPVDNAAQGDSFTVDVRFDLIQAGP